ncbi:MAG: P-II family nitrogen regulator [Methanomicrobiales archaeon]|nr:P-II family nitrogen regulator [Methanomicrobiales archaeon]
MKKIEAIIRPEKLQQVKLALAEADLFPMTVTEVRGRGAQKGICLQYRGKKMEVDLIPKVKIEMVIRNDDVPRAIGAIRAAARTGKFGDGRIFVLPVEQSANVRIADSVTEDG